MKYREAEDSFYIISRFAFHSETSKGNNANGLHLPFLCEPGCVE